MIRYIRAKALPRECRIIRVMPNTPALVQKGASVFVRGSLATESDVDLTKTLFGSVGICDEVPEYLLDPVTALSGSGPAFVSFRTFIYLRIFIAQQRYLCSKVVNYIYK